MKFAHFTSIDEGVLVERSSSLKVHTRFTMGILRSLTLFIQKLHYMPKNEFLLLVDIIFQINENKNLIHEKSLPGYYINVFVVTFISRMLKL